jgi:hypothetical protein
MSKPDPSASRADPFAVASEPDISAFRPTPARKPPVTRDTLREVAEQNNFPSREPAPKRAAAPPVKKQRRRRTGRNTQFNIKARQEDIDRFYTINDTQGWVLGETFAHALDALEKTLAAKK